MEGDPFYLKFGVPARSKGEHRAPSHIMQSERLFFHPSMVFLQNTSVPTIIAAGGYVHRVSKKTSTHIIGYKLSNSCPILIIFDIKIPHII